jgi:hypothetical protein
LRRAFGGLSLATDISIGIDILLVGGASAYAALFSGGVATISATLGLTAVGSAATGMGLLVGAIIFVGAKVLVMINWTREAAN